jgi:hypothetical protein
MYTIDRRHCLGWGVSAAGTILFHPSLTALASSPFGSTAGKKKVAAVATTYFKNSHADVILGKIMGGWLHDGGPGPNLELVSLYLDQVHVKDIGKTECARHSVPIFDSIEKALTIGGSSIPVDAVISIGEHGDYPHNALGQHLYPRRRFFSEIAATMEKYGKIVPVFSDKHIGPEWADAKWIYDRAKQLDIPFMAGSSLPVGYRIHEINLPMATKIKSAVGIGYSGLDVYGIHALEFYQYHVERRLGAESGVESVQFLRGEAIGKAIDSGIVSSVALQAALDVVPKAAAADVRQDKQAGLMLFRYRDGFQGAVLMLSCVNGTAIGLECAAPDRVLATAFDERSEPRYPHFAYLVKAIEKMAITGKPTYPIERTLLTSGILDKIHHSRAQGDIQIPTPELAIQYRPVDYPHAPNVPLIE